MDQTTANGVKITFEQGLPGFEELRAFYISKPLADSPFYYLQAAPPEDICLLLINPFEVTTAYEFNLPEAVLAVLEIKEPADVAVFNVVNARQGLANATVNLQAPVVINVRQQKGMQVVLNEPAWQVREPLSNLLQGKVGQAC
ncbi:flagellar assembly protein FliW [Desulforamulus hydrothermalis]|uniref:Flagellar assembly factor FliW n=1 Tax=Desulforamulus hydrothermalis Lam5 = DSM 18033 TaxID=1121428 RepID=K8E0N1_9FIRM|nr:flagellar assembly protein FliW [Desulforamulus hydrothermalis]CCO09152.1 Putative flagellar protein FliW [Desulforamulus hydrothermalis Lam5 = DSM 18033]SHH11612.1 flagellar assembly factor FliW [Desulforamulus hydrothermalis Lam5 = DSM 18033]